MLPSEQEAKALCQRLLGYTKADDASVGVQTEGYSHLRFAADTFTTSGRRDDVEANVTCWIEGKKGTASTNEMDDASLEAAVRQAEQLARLSPLDREYLPTLGPQQYKPSHGYVEATAPATSCATTSTWPSSTPRASPASPSARHSARATPAR